MRVNLPWYDIILVNSSAGKDSQAMLHKVVKAAVAAGVKDRVVVAHCDLKRVEWRGTRELAQKQADAYGVRFEVVSRPQGDLLDHVRARGKWPSSTTRYCTSDHKRGQVSVLMTRLTNEMKGLGRPVRILNCLGLRAEESPARSKRLAFSLDRRATNGRRTVHTWLPLHSFTTSEVWSVIRESGVPHHPAYDLGLPRVSCVFCVLSPRKALVLAGKHNPELLAEYVAVEKEIGHSFRKELPIAEIKRAVDEGETTNGVIRDWNM